MSPITAIAGQSVGWYCSLGIVVFGLLSALMSTAYTLALKRVNVTTLSVLSYIAPLIFLVVDNVIGHTFSAIQIFAIVGLVLGGIGFALDERLTIDAPTLGLLVFMLGYSGAQFYYLQYLHKTEAVTGISFFANVWGGAAVFLLVHLVVRRKAPLLLTEKAWAYARLSVMAKSFDVGASLLAGMALMITTVTQFSSMQVFLPLMMLVMVLLAQRVGRLDLGECVDNRTIGRKACMAVGLAGCGVFV